MLKDYFFWFSQPSSLLNNADYIFGYSAAGLFALAILLWFLNRFLKHTIVKKLLSKIITFAFWISLLGLLWFGLRYENTPIFAKRIWFAGIMLIALIWLLFIFRYLFSRFRSEKKEYDLYLINSRYLPGGKK